MRTGLLSNLEKKMLKDYLKTGTKTQDFFVLMHRIRKNIKRIQEEYKLILAVLEQEVKKT